MGNLSFVVPTQKLDDYNIDKIFDLLKNNFKEVKIEKLEDWNEIVIHSENGKDLLFNLYFNQECYLLNFDEDIKELIILNHKNLADKLEDLKKLNPDLNNTISISYGSLVGYSHKYKHIRSSILYFLKDYFYAYIFDEGIHPEYIEPEHKRKR